MGYDCTLHVIDEGLIRERFVPRLLGESDLRAAFDAREDAEELWSQVRDSLTGDDPDNAASYVCQLAIAYCAAELPYHYERGFCLSLLSMETGPAADIPSEFSGDPQTLFERVVERHPQLDCCFPTSIVSNYCPGMFVPAAKLPGLINRLRQKLLEYDKGEARQFHGLMRVLERAAELGLGYWEGTDLPVAWKKIEAASAPAKIEQVDFPKGYAKFVASGGSTLIFSNGPGDDCWTIVADLQTWPPTLTQSEEFSRAAAISPGGRLLTVSMLGRDYRYRARVRPDAMTAPVLLGIEGSDRQLGLTFGGFIGEKVVGVRGFEKEFNLPGTVLIESGQGDTMISATGEFPIQREPMEFEKKYCRCPGLIQLEDGSTVLVWNDAGYELVDGQFRCTFPALDKPSGNEISATPWGPVGFFYIANNDEKKRRLFHIVRGGPPVLHLPTVPNVMYVGAGPNRSVLVRQGDNKKGDLGVIYFPDEQCFIRVEDELLGDLDPRDVSTLHWIESIDRLVFATPVGLWAMPMSDVLTRKKYNSLTGRQIKV